MPLTRVKIARLKIARMQNTLFVQIPSRIVQSKKLSLKSIGLLAYMLSKNHDKVTIEIIKSEVPDGGDSINTAMKQLKKYGLIEFKRYSDGSGEYIINLKALNYES